MASVVCTAHRHGRDGPDVRSRWGRVFSYQPRQALSLPIQWVPGLFPRGKWPGRCADHPPPSSAEVKERLELCFCSHSVFMACCRVNFTFLRELHLRYEVHVTVLSFNVTFFQQPVAFGFLNKKVYQSFIYSPTDVLGELS